MSQLPIPLPLNESRWRYVTASGGGVTVAFLAGSGGSITLLSPEGENVSFRYGGVGGGIGLGMRLPRFGKVNLNVKGKSVGGAGALEALPSTGTVLVADGLVGRDLSRGDFTGPCMYVELGAGVIAGGSGTAILFGLDPKLLAAVALASASPLTAALGASMSRQLLQSSRGALLMAGSTSVHSSAAARRLTWGRCSDAGGRSGRIALFTLRRRAAVRAPLSSMASGAVAEIVTGAGNGRRRFRTGVDRFFPNKPIHSFEVSCLCPG